MLQVWQINKLIYLNLCHTIDNTRAMGRFIFMLGYCVGKISAHWTQPEWGCRRAEKLVAGGLKVAEMS